MQKVGIRVVRIPKDNLKYERCREITTTVGEVIRDGEYVRHRTKWLELVLMDHNSSRRGESNFGLATVRGHFFHAPFTGIPIHAESCASWSNDMSRFSPLPNEEFSVTVTMRHDEEAEFYPATIVARKQARDNEVLLGDGRYFLHVEIDARNQRTRSLWFWIRFEGHHFSVTELFSRPTLGMGVHQPLPTE